MADIIRIIAICLCLMAIGFVSTLTATTLEKRFYARTLRYLSYIMFAMFSIIEVAIRIGHNYPISWRTPLTFTASILGAVGMYLDREP